MDRPHPHKLRDRAPRQFRSDVFVSTLLMVALAACSRSSHRDDRIRLTDVPTARAAQAPSSGLQNCPGVMSSQLSDLHKVTLTWNASTSSTGPNDTSIRYCLYRSDSEITANRLGDCPACQKITPTPIIGTSCIDNFGDGSKTYYFAAIAIDSGGHQSVFSNKTAASLSGKKPNNQASNVQPPQSCRTPDGSNPAPQTASPTKR
jgi:hypothetical protein